MSPKKDTKPELTMKGLSGVSQQYRHAAGADRFEGSGSTAELDDTPFDGDLPVTGGETQMPGSERLNGFDAAELTAPEQTEDVETRLTPGSPDGTQPVEGLDPVDPQPDDPAGTQPVDSHAGGSA